MKIIKIITIGAVTLTSLHSFAQDNTYDAAGYKIEKAPVKKVQNHTESVAVINPDLDENGIDKTIRVLPKEPVLQQTGNAPAQYFDEAGRPSQVKVEENVYIPKDIKNEVIEPDYRKKGDHPVRLTNAASENYTRIKPEDIPANTQSTVNDNYQRSNSISEPLVEYHQVPAVTVQSVKIQSVDAKQVANQESDQRLSDDELNKKYPDRNGKYVKPGTGDNMGISDVEKMKQPKKAIPVASQSSKKNKLRDDELNTKK